MQRIRHFIEQSWLLVAAAVFFGVLLAVTNSLLAEKIEQQRIDKLNRLAGELVPDAEHFVPLDSEIEIKSPRGKPEFVEAYKATKGDDIIGWSFNIIGSGFADKIALVVAVDPNFTEMLGYNVLSSNETPGFGDKIKNDFFRNQFAGSPVGQLMLKKSGDSKKIDEEIISITGATVSSQAVVDAVSNALVQIRDALEEMGLVGSADKSEDDGGGTAEGQVQ